MRRIFKTEDMKKAAAKRKGTRPEPFNLKIDWQAGEPVVIEIQKGKGFLAASTDDWRLVLARERNLC